MATYRTYPWRWGVLATTGLTNMTCFCLTTSYYSVATSAASYFKVDQAQLDALTQINMIILPVFMLVAVFVLNRFGLKVRGGNLTGALYI